jgi:hypothetical protein
MILGGGVTAAEVIHPGFPVRQDTSPGAAGRPAHPPKGLSGFDLHFQRGILTLGPACCLSRLLGGLSDERQFSGDSKLDGRERAED